MNSPNTPGFFGYVLAVGISAAVFGLVLGLFAMTSAEDPMTALAIGVIYVPMGAVFAGIFGCPVAIAGVAVVELGCGRVPSQWVHVLAAGCAGLVLTPIYLRLCFGGDWELVLTGPAVGVAAALGRLSVVPLVSSRRRLAAQGRLSGTARWYTGGHPNESEDLLGISGHKRPSSS